MDTHLNHAMESALERNWWVYLVSGVAAILFGLLIFFWPDIGLLTLILLFGIYVIITGIFNFARAFSVRKQGLDWIWPLLAGIVSIAAGIIAFVWPGLTGLALLFLIAVWALVTGICEIIAGIALRHEIDHEWLLVLGGVVSVLFGLLVFLRPGAGAVAVAWLIGFYAIVLGIVRVTLAFRVRDYQQHAMTGGLPGMPPAAA